MLHAAQQERKAALDQGRVDTVFQVGDQVLLRTKELLDAAEIGKLRPRWEGPFRVAALAGPNAYTLALPKRFKCSPTVNVERLKPYFGRDARPTPPGPVSDPGQEGEYVVEQLLNRKVIRGRMHYLVRWQGHDSTDDSWEPVEHLTNCPERIADYEAAASRRSQALPTLNPLVQAPSSDVLPPQPPPTPSPPAGWTLSPWAPPLAGPSRRARRYCTGGPRTAGSRGAWIDPLPGRRSPTLCAIDALRRPSRVRWTRCSMPTRTGHAGCCSRGLRQILHRDTCYRQ